jgi:hypothetical protein
MVFNIASFHSRATVCCAASVWIKSAAAKSATIVFEIGWYMYAGELDFLKQSASTRALTDTKYQEILISSVLSRLTKVAN